jgi:hypothetical protein
MAEAVDIHTQSLCRVGEQVAPGLFDEDCASLDTLKALILIGGNLAAAY